MGMRLIVSFWDEGIKYSIIFILCYSFFFLGLSLHLLVYPVVVEHLQNGQCVDIKTKRGAKLLTVFLGIAIFVDDYFNALAVGQIARPITDQHQGFTCEIGLFHRLDFSADLCHFPDFKLGCFFNWTTRTYFWRCCSN